MVWFFGSYLGGIFGGVATLLAVVYTIKSNKKEQERKEKIERQKTIQKSAVIVYYDFQFALDEIVQFMNNYAFFFWTDNKNIRTLPPNAEMRHVLSGYFDN